MGHDVFISYSSKDKAIADAACAAIEAAGPRCWIAPRDITPGTDWAEEILAGIAACRAVVLVFSSHANASPQVKRELERAVSRSMPILPIRVDQALPSGSLEYFIMTRHWLDASVPPIESHLGKLTQSVTDLLGPPKRVQGNDVPVSMTDPVAAMTLRAVRNESDAIREHIHQATNEIIDHLQPKALHDSSVVPSLPSPPNEFIGREVERRELAARVLHSALHIVGINGQGGIGKTALALAIGQALAPQYPDGQLLIDLRGTTQPLGVRQAMEQILLRIQPRKVLNTLDDTQVTNAYLDTLACRELLLIFDNAATEAQVNPLVPGGKCGVIVTSRKHIVVKGVSFHRLDLLSDGDAVRIARTIAPRLTDAEATELAAACGRLALAIRVGATQIANYPTIRPADHIADLRDDRLAYLDGVEPDEPDGLRFAHRAFELSFRLLSPDLQEFWPTLAVFSGTFYEGFAGPISVEANPAAAKELITRHLGELHRAAMVEFDARLKRYYLHDLAREFAWKRKLGESDRTRLGKQHARRFARVLSDADGFFAHGNQPIGIAMLDAELENIRTGQAWAAKHQEADSDAARLVMEFPVCGADILRFRIHPLEQISWLQSRLAACRVPVRPLR